MTRLTKFKPYENVIWMRKKQIRKISAGKSGLLLPRIDKVIIFNKLTSVSDIDGSDGYISVHKLYSNDVVEFKARTLEEKRIEPGKEVYLIGFDSRNTLIVDDFPNKRLGYISDMGFLIIFFSELLSHLMYQ